MCFPPYTQIKCDQGRIKIVDIDKDSHTINGRRIEYVTAVKNKNQTVVEIDKNSFGVNLPSETLHISWNHRIVIRDKIVKARMLVESYPSKCRFVKYTKLLYNISMKKHTLMNAQGLIVETIDPFSAYARIFRYLNENEISLEEIEKLYSTAKIKS